MLAVLLGTLIKIATLMQNAAERCAERWMQCGDAVVGVVIDHADAETLTLHDKN
jgi:hypothetical protein